jgi:hypothetical protein
MEAPSKMKKEFEVYQNNLEAWRQSEMGKFVLIKNADVIGFFATLEEAMKKGFEMYGTQDFFVKQILPSDSVHISFFGKRIKSA